MITIALTGGIGSGKSTVCCILTDRGIPVYDTDSAAKRLYVSDDTLLDSVEEAFGCGLRLPGGSFDRQKLSSIVFSSPEKLRTLEGIVHPAVLKDFIRWKTMLESRFDGVGESDTFYGREPFCVIESAIILDKEEFMAEVDKVILVNASLQTRLKRACSRDGTDPGQVIRRMALQNFDISKVDAVIRNDGDFKDLEKEVSKVFHSLNF